MGKLREPRHWHWYLRCSLLATLAACRVPTVTPLYASNATPTLQVWLSRAPAQHDSLRYEISLVDVPLAWVTIESASESTNEPANATTNSTPTEAATVIRATMQLAGATRALFDANVDDSATMSKSGQLLRSTVDVVGTLNSHC